MNIRSLILGLISLILLNGCSTRTSQVPQKTFSWEEQLTQQIRLLGHRNWIVVADAAYPLQSNPGITTILSTDDHLSTIDAVMELLQQQGHVKPILYLDKEIDYIAETDAPGIEAFRKDIERYADYKINKEIHEDIIRKLDKASELFNVIIIKTDFAIPYTSLFLQLDCKYWNAEAENRLRNKINENE